MQSDQVPEWTIAVTWYTIFTLFIGILITAWKTQASGVGGKNKGFNESKELDDNLQYKQYTHTFENFLISNPREIPSFCN